MQRIILVRPPGSKGTQIALPLADHFRGEEGDPAGSQMEVISTGDMLDKEITKHSAFGKEIEEARRTHTFVRDEIVIQFVKN